MDVAAEMRPSSSLKQPKIMSYSKSIIAICINVYSRLFSSLHALVSAKSSAFWVDFMSDREFYSKGEINLVRAYLASWASVSTLRYDPATNNNRS